MSYSVLVGNGALQWACDHGFKEVNTSSLITPRALSAYRKHKRALTGFSTLPSDQQETLAKRMKGDGSPVVGFFILFYLITAPIISDTILVLSRVSLIIHVIELQKVFWNFQLRFTIVLCYYELITVTDRFPRL